MKNKPPTVIIKDFSTMRHLDFFVRLHRHQPDEHCGVSPIAPCNYREDQEPINIANERVGELKKDPAFVKKEQEVEKAVKAFWENKSANTEVNHD